MSSTGSQTDAVLVGQSLIVSEALLELNPILSDRAASHRRFDVGGTVETRDLHTALTVKRDARGVRRGDLAVSVEAGLPPNIDASIAADRTVDVQVAGYVERYPV